MRDEEFPADALPFFHRSDHIIMPSTKITFSIKSNLIDVLHTNKPVTLLLTHLQFLFVAQTPIPEVCFFIFLNKAR